MPFCQKCGAMNKDDAVKCSKCGNPLTQDRRLGNLLILIIAIIMVVVTVVGLLLYG
ncbi:MAG TPA: zinc-ribbon domain-containing protein [Methanomassiliicoccales archaeon]|nr:zinc-ribbon domain-containing protein [Methanomassiliicoccales archaeon]